VSCFEPLGKAFEQGGEPDMDAQYDANVTATLIMMVMQMFHTVFVRITYMVEPRPCSYERTHQNLSYRALHDVNTNEMP
jgi:hypothetical protein